MRESRSAFMAVGVVFGSSLRHVPLSWTPSLIFPQTHQPPTPEKHLVHLGAWFCPQEAQRQINPRRPCKKGAEEMPCYPSWETTSYDSRCDGKSQAAGQEGWPGSILSFPVDHSSPMERKGEVTFLKHCSSQTLKRELLWVESQLDSGQTWLVLQLERRSPEGVVMSRVAGTGG